jgi:hypothetical protein
VAYLLVPTHPMPANNRYTLQYRHTRESGCISSRHPPSMAIVNSAQINLSTRISTCLILHFHPFLFSCGHLSAKVAFRASIILVLAGYSSLSSLSWRSTAATIAHPQCAECLRCSANGSSSSSHPSRDLWQRKHIALSGLLCVGW